MYITLMVIQKGNVTSMTNVLAWLSCSVVVFSHDLIAKNNPTMAKSAAMTAGVSLVSGNPNPACRVYISCNNFGVIARCRFGAGLAFSKALKRERVAGCSWAEPSICRGLGWRLSQNTVAK